MSATSAAAAATVAALTPNVLLGCSRRSLRTVRIANPALNLRLNTLSLKPPSQFPNKSALLNFTLSASEDTASVDTKVDTGVKVDGEEQQPAEDTDGGIPSSKVTEETVQSLEEQSEKSKAILDEMVNNLKDVSKLQDATKQAYTESAEKAIGVLRDTTEQLKEQAEKARAVLLATAQETAVRGKENLTILAQTYPDPLVKDIAETALDAHLSEKSKTGARIHDFCLGIPYGSVLLVGGLLWFLLTGSTAAIRFGVFLGGLVLAMSVTSLKVWKRGESSMSYIIGQAAIATVLLVRELRRFSEVRRFFPHAVIAVLSAAMLAFYVYVYVSGGNPPKKSKASA